MKLQAATTVLALIALAGCATPATSPATARIPAGLKAGQFVELTCEGGKRMTARAAADGSSVRIRFEGGYELDRKSAESFEGEGFRFVTSGATAELEHNGKVVAKGCRSAA